ncbi:MAG: hypothetical protein VCC04_06895, partial [Myxococcota bacterium]
DRRLWSDAGIGRHRSHRIDLGFVPLRDSPARDALQTDCDHYGTGQNQRDTEFGVAHQPDREALEQR